MLSGEPFRAETHRATKDPGKPAGWGNGVWQDRKTRKLWERTQRTRGQEVSSGLVTWVLFSSGFHLKPDRRQLV